MKCKNCGGELTREGNINICQSCGSKTELKTIHENIEIYICYEENDTNGRRTKDSIIAQEVYQHLKAAGIDTFYERISADSVIGDELDDLRAAAILKSKAVIVLGAGAESFSSLEKKYGELLNEKTVIPFCVDMEPNEIPKTFSKIQAINHSKIGWEKDLIKGLFNLLGKKEDVDTVALYKKTKKNKSIIISVAAVIVICLAAIAVTLISQSDKSDTDKAQTTTEAVNQQEVYNEATALMKQGELTEALGKFALIPDHPDTANKLKLIYSKYEGYYKSDDMTLHLVVVDNTRADIEATLIRDSSNIVFSSSSTIKGSEISGNYRDNLQQTGTVEVTLEDDGFSFSYTADGSADKKTSHFIIAEKSDKPFTYIDGNTLFNWLEETYTIAQIREEGYEIEQVSVMDRAGTNRVYKIKDTEIYLSMFSYIVDEGKVGKKLEDRILLGVQAPAEIIAPKYIGEKSAPFVKDDIIYCPNGRVTGEGPYFDFSIDSSTQSGSTITKETLVGVVIKSGVTNEQWETVYNSTFNNSSSIFYESALETMYVAVDEGLNLRDQPSTSGNIITVMRVGQAVDVLEYGSTGEWVKVRCGTNTGYCAVEYLTSSAPVSGSGSTSTIKVTDGIYHVYKGPSYTSDRIQSLPVGTYTIVEKQTDENGKQWGRLKSGIGWVCLSDM